MNGAIVSALAALGGSALGGMTPIVSNYLIQRGLTERELFSRDLAARQALYSDFIEFGTKLYVSATTKQLDDFSDLIPLYALISRIRLFASNPVIGAAEEFATQMTRRFGEAAISIEDLRSAALVPHVDPLNAFSSRCKEELKLLFRHK